MSLPIIDPFWLPKQKRVINWFFDHTQTEVKQLLYGGAAGGGKTRVGVSAIALAALLYDGSRWVIGRSRLKTLKETTLVSLWEVFGEWGLIRDVHYRFNEKDNYIIFPHNKSVIILKDLFYYPSDVNWDSLGSLEVCGSFVDEVPQVVSRGIEVLRSRHRYNLKKWCECGQLNERNEIIEVEEIEIDGEIIEEPTMWLCGKCGVKNRGLQPKLLMSCNPSRGWVFKDFYDLWKKGKMPKDRYFLPAYAHENFKLSDHYLEALNSMSTLDRERLANGNWEYSDYTAIFDYLKVQSFLSSKGKSKGERHFMSVDVARLGRDKTVIWIMNENKCIVHLEVMEKARTNEVAKKIKKLAEKFDVDLYDIVIDTDGVGGGVADHFDGETTELMNNAKPLEGENYENLKTQLYFCLAEQINEGLITFAEGVINDEVAELIAEELEVIKRTKVDKDGKIAMTPKGEIKQLLKRSPDYSDGLAYLCYHIKDDRLNDSYLFM